MTAIYNVVSMVVDLVKAESEADAVHKLTTRLEAAGFHVHYDHGYPNAFLSEPVDEDDQ